MLSAATVHYMPFITATFGWALPVNAFEYSNEITKNEYIFYEEKHEGKMFLSIGLTCQNMI